MKTESKSEGGGGVFGFVHAAEVWVNLADRRQRKGVLARQAP